MARLRLGVLISGRGSNLQALIDACAAPDFPAEIALVISNKADAAGLAPGARGVDPVGGYFASPARLRGRPRCRAARRRG